MQSTVKPEVKPEVAVFIRSHHGKHLKLDIPKWVDFGAKQSWDSQGVFTLVTKSRDG